MKVECDVNPLIPELRLFHKKKKFLRWCAERFGQAPEVIEGADAQMVYVDGVAAVLFRVEDEPVWENALIVHESYHIVCAHLHAIGEESAGEEIFAYLIQCVSGSLMEAHGRWRARHASDED